MWLGELPSLVELNLIDAVTVIAVDLGAAGALTPPQVAAANAFFQQQHALSQQHQQAQHVLLQADRALQGKAVAKHRAFMACVESTRNRNRLSRHLLGFEPAPQTAEEIAEEMPASFGAVDMLPAGGGGALAASAPAAAAAVAPAPAPALAQARIVAAVCFKIRFQDETEALHGKFMIQRDCPLEQSMAIYAQQQGGAPSAYRFLFDGNRIVGTQTPDDLDMIDDDIIDAMLEPGLVGELPPQDSCGKLSALRLRESHERSALCGLRHLFPVSGASLLSPRLLVWFWQVWQRSW